MPGLWQEIKMPYGTTKTGKIHVFTTNNECICDLNININKQVSKEYVTLHQDKLCLTCANLIKKVGEL